MKILTVGRYLYIISFIFSVRRLHLYYSIHIMYMVHPRVYTIIQKRYTSRNRLARPSGNIIVHRRCI